VSAADREIDRQLEIIRAGTEVFVGETDLRRRLAECVASGRPLRVKLGMDPSTPDLHLGHTVTLEKLRLFQDLGHTPIFLIGDFTAQIGDPSGRKKTRPALSADEVRQNARTYIDQVGKILDVNRTEIRYNNEWMGRMSPVEFVRLCSHYTVARLLERDDFAKRFREELPISVHELLYPLVQGYDSVALEADVELGGSDQLFNLLVGRDLQRAYGRPPQAVITHPLLVGTDGREKMSKSLGNTIGLYDAPPEIYGRVMSIPDALMPAWIQILGVGRWQDLAERVAELEAGAGDPLRMKELLATRLVERLHGPDAAREAATHFQRVVREGGLPDEIPSCRVTLGETGFAGLLDVMRSALAVPSNAEARRLVSQGAVEVDGERVSDAALRLGEGTYVVRVGRRRVARIRIERPGGVVRPNLPSGRS
jgi:tyrosyl-tRNA synthetase